MDGISPAALVAFLVLVTGVFYVGSMTGFGITVLMVTFASQLVSVDVLLPVVVPLNLTFGSYIAWRYRRFTEWRLLLTRILPLVALGIPIGLVLFRIRDVVWLRIGLGVFVTVLAALQLRITYSQDNPEPHPVGRWRAVALLGFGGVVHALYATAGPILVYVIGRRIVDKRAFRSTVATMFLVLNCVLEVNYLATGLVTVGVLKMIALSLPAMLLGIWLGERTFGRLDPQRFRRGVWLLLLAGGVMLTVRALLLLR